jgi:hypothetical protein
MMLMGSIVGLLLTILVGALLNLFKERRQQFRELEEQAGQLVEELSSHRSLDRSIVVPMLQKLQQATGRSQKPSFPSDLERTYVGSC